MARYLCAGYGYATKFKKKALTDNSAQLKPSLSDLNAYLEQEFGRHGVAIALIYADKVQYQLHGLADIENNIALTADTLFEIGSVTKPLVALSALRQVQAGRWQLQQQVSTLTDTPALTKHGYTLADLLTHRSGLPRLPDNLLNHASNQTDAAASSQQMSNPYASYDAEALLSAAGAQEFSERHFNYSNYGYGLLGYLLCVQQQQNLDTLLQEQVFLPLGMTKARLQRPNQHYSPLAQGHALGAGKVPHWQFGVLAGAGAVLASVRDMATMLQTVMTQPQQDKALALWLTPIAQDTEPNMTPGWMLQNGIYWHAGQTAGFSSFVAFEPQSQSGIVILTNLALPVTTQGFMLLQQWQGANQATKSTELTKE